MALKREIIAKLKFYFGREEDIFNDKVTVEITDNGYVYIYKK